MPELLNGLGKLQLGAGDFDVAYRVVLKQILPKVLNSIRLNLKAIISQRLVPTLQGKRTVALEIMLNQGQIRDLVAKGEVEFGFGQVSEFINVPGLVNLGPLPAALQNYTTYAAGVSAAKSDSGSGRCVSDPWPMKRASAERV